MFFRNTSDSKSTPIDTDITEKEMLHSFFKVIDVPIEQRFKDLLEAKDDAALDKEFSVSDQQLCYYQARTTYSERVNHPEAKKLIQSLENPDNQNKPKTPSQFYREQLILGLAYYHGIGVNKDYIKARDHYMLASGGIPAARYLLGYMLEEGKGFERNEKQALIFMKESAAQGCGEGYRELGYGFHFGTHTLNKCHDSAFKEYKKSADQGSPSGIYSLGFCFEEKVGVPQNFTKANAYFKQAVSYGYALAFHPLGLAYKRGDSGLSKDVAKAAFYFRLMSLVGMTEVNGNELLKLMQNQFDIHVSYHAAISLNDPKLFNKAYQIDANKILELVNEDMKWGSELLSTQTRERLQAFLKKHEANPVTAKIHEALKQTVKHDDGITMLMLPGYYPPGGLALS